MRIIKRGEQEKSSNRPRALCRGGARKFSKSLGLWRGKSPESIQFSGHIYYVESRLALLSALPTLYEGVPQNFFQVYRPMWREKLGIFLSASGARNLFQVPEHVWLLAPRIARCFAHSLSIYRLWDFPTYRSEPRIYPSLKHIFPNMT